ncbi:MAG TPA: carbamoyltransferase HypF [Thiotrichales bacterium]|nr:carbamoyltransferase HypF [Thiotrichales bacterium]
MPTLRHSATQALEIRVSGTVQGVGFRPAVWRLAHRYGIRGEVHNDAGGVNILAWGDASALQLFVDAIGRESPPLARIVALETRPLAGAGSPTGFHIGASKAGPAATHVPPDVATCPECLAEVLDPADRRAGYPFTNCTRCGPRFSIVRALPYDRSNTSMAPFALCPRCRQEYEDPSDRRFHAQPTACPECGPRLWLEGADGETETSAPLASAVALLRRGKILAVKGIGGFHLVVDATDQAAVKRLRHRKRRPTKPLALMARDLEVIRRYRRLSPAEEEALLDPAAPVVLLEKPAAERLPEAITPGPGATGNTTPLAFMLPMSPLHHLLLAPFDTPLVFTSGNLSGHPQCTDNRQARQQLGGIADAFLLHDREIVNRLDDSVVRLIGGRARPLRRGRGHAPAPILLPGGFEEAAAVTALGGEQKNTFCLLCGREAILSQHVGDLEQPSTLEQWRASLGRYADLYRHRPERLAVDSHPDYHASRHGEAWAERERIPLERVQHHHAHLASCLAENGHPLAGEAVLGLILDGLGHGDDGTLWGGELLLGDYGGYRRLARLSPAPLPGGTVAMREPWRNLAARLLLHPSGEALLHRYHRVAPIATLQRRPLTTLRRMIERGFNSPLASSTGRLFDAVAALLGVAPDRLTFEGEAATNLERLAWQASHAHPLRFARNRASDDLWELDPTPLWPALLEALADGVEPAALAAGFHLALADGWIALCSRLAREAGVKQVALSGGVFQNRLLHERIEAGLREAGLEPLSHHRVPAGDGGLALGQACVAAARPLLESRR